VGLGFVAGWLYLLRAGRDFNILLLGLLLIGYFQGYLDKVTGGALPGMIWGLAKYAILGLMVIGLLLRLAQKPVVRVSTAMKLWLLIWGAICLCLAGLMVEAKLMEPRYSPIASIQSFGIGNMVLAIIVYFEVRERYLARWLRLLTWLGVLAALFGIVQRLLGPSRMSLVGIPQSELMRSMAFLAAETAETGHLDLETGLRAFSFFDTHHAFSAFLVLAILALLVLNSQRMVRRSAYWLGMAVLGLGLVVTFNLTNILSTALALLIFIFLQRGGRLSAIGRIFKSKRTWQAITVAAVGIALVLMTSATVRNRILGVFDVRQGAAGAGGSLAYRLEGFVSGAQAVVDYPLGFGLFLSATGGIEYGSPLNRYVRVNGYFEERQVFFSGDNWFQWLSVQLGLPLFLLYLLLFILPIVAGWQWRNGRPRGLLRSMLHACLTLVVVVFAGGVSNSPILAFPPSNLLFWGAVGLLMRLATKSWETPASLKREKLT
jgi:hypothetical protein